jgi:protoheme IX farnesyltransferase
MRTHSLMRLSIALERSGVMDYVALTKPELTFLSVVTALAGYCLGASGVTGGTGMVHTLVGTAIAGGGSGSLNQYIERHFDARMKRTAHRPLPSGRLVPAEALLFGLTLSIGGTVYLALCVNLLTAWLAAVTCATYLLLYTPLKRLTPVATLIGSIPGAIPPVMGWTAARNEINSAALILFAIVVFWQLPHFLSLAWLYRKDYTQAGYRLLPAADTGGSKTSASALLATALLVPVSLLLVAAGETGMTYAVSASLLGGGFLICSLRFHLRRTALSARRLFVASLMYIPALVLCTIIDRLVR